MFITPEQVMEATPYTDITSEQVLMAQFVIEACVGKTEAQVDSPKDRAMLARAVAFQTVYMRENPDIVFEQVKASSISSGGQMTAFSDDLSPFIAPLAVLTCKNLSWKKSRSVRVGKMFQRIGMSPREKWVRN